ncbi:MAG: anti-sigma factor [Solirubrobacterales bacterium]|nr:anti-sigma factor [Solirubrobacterales bacterium]
MSSGLEHRECAEALAAYALGALPENEGSRVYQHLTRCRECRAELDWLRAAVDTLPASVPQIPPPAELKTRVLAVVEAEAELLRAAGDTPDSPQPRAPRRRFPVTRALRPALVLVSACVVAVVVVLLAATGGTGSRTIQARVTGPALAARAAVSLQVNGARATLIVKGLPTPPADHVDELWVMRGKSAPQPAGTFVVQSGSVEVGRAVRRGDLVLVTEERGRGTAAPTSTPFIVATV